MSLKVTFSFYMFIFSLQPANKKRSSETQTDQWHWSIKVRTDIGCLCILQSTCPPPTPPTSMLIKRRDGVCKKERFFLFTGIYSLSTECKSTLKLGERGYARADLDSVFKCAVVHISRKTYRLCEERFFLAVWYPKSNSTFCTCMGPSSSKR